MLFFVAYLLHSYSITKLFDSSEQSTTHVVTPLLLRPCIRTPIRKDVANVSASWQTGAQEAVHFSWQNGCYDVSFYINRGVDPSYLHLR